SLANLILPDTTITVAAVVPAGTFDPPGPTPPIDTVACRVAGSIKPTSDSDIRFEVWMPTAGWNGKFLSAGEGGYAGAINYGGIVWNEQALWNTPGAFISPSKLAAVQAATLATCDALDGVSDGVVEDPRRCTFDPTSLACPAGSDGASCLTPQQATALRTIM